MVNTHNKNQLNLIQVYRGLAAILVLFHHGNIIFNRDLSKDFLGNIFGFGWAGVDFFFVLSGFIIFYIHQSDIGKPREFKSFILKRIIRIYPLYWIILAVKVFASLTIGYKGNGYNINPLELFKAIILFPQDRAILEEKFLGVSWTLSYEMFFYIVFSLVLILGFRFMSPVIAVWVIGIIINIMGVTNFFPVNSMSEFIFNGRNIEFLFGCLSAYLVSRYNCKYGMALITLGTFLLSISAIIDFDYRRLSLSPVLAFGLPFTLIILGSVSIEKNSFVKIPSILIAIGNASYAIYLIHGFLINNFTKIFTALLNDLNFTTPYQGYFIINLLAIIIAVLSVACGIFTYMYVEKPILKFLRIRLRKIVPVEVKNVKQPPLTQVK